MYHTHDILMRRLARRLAAALSRRVRGLDVLAVTGHDLTDQGRKHGVMSSKSPRAGVEPLAAWGFAWTGLRRGSARHELPHPDRRVHRSGRIAPSVESEQMNEMTATRQSRRGRRFKLVFAAVIAGVLFATVAIAGQAANPEIGATPPIKKISGGDGAVTANPRGARYLFVAQACCAGGNGWAPGEPSIAVGKADIVETVNSSVTVYAKGATQPAEVFHQDLTSFFGGGPIACVDPRVIYWSWNDRYALVC